MSYTGTIINGQVQLPKDVVLPEGTKLRIEVLPEMPLAPVADALLALSKDRDWPTDMSLNHDHYLHGMPRR